MIIQSSGLASICLNILNDVTHIFNPCLKCHDNMCTKQIDIHSTYCETHGCQLCKKHNKQASDYCEDHACDFTNCQNSKSTTDIYCGKCHDEPDTCDKQAGVECEYCDDHTCTYSKCDRPKSPTKTYCDTCHGDNDTCKVTLDGDSKYCDEHAANAEDDEDAEDDDDVESVVESDAESVVESDECEYCENPNDTNTNSCGRCHIDACKRDARSDENKHFYKFCGECHGTNCTNKINSIQDIELIYCTQHINYSEQCAVNECEEKKDRDSHFCGMCHDIDEYGNWCHDFAIDKTPYCEAHKPEHDYGDISA